MFSKAKQKYCYTVCNQFVEIYSSSS